MRAWYTATAKHLQALPPRERRAVAIAAAVIGIALVWMVGVAPALRTLDQAPAQINALDAQLQTMQGLAAEARELRGVAPVSAGQAALALQSATDRLGAAGRITVQGDRATLSLTGVTGEGLRAWLAEARSGARARPVEAQLTRGPQGYSGTLTVTVGGGS